MHGIITELALKFLNDFAISPNPTAVFLREDEIKDEAQLYSGYYEANRAWDNLLELGLVEDARPTKGKWLDDLEVKTQRQFRMFQLTNNGKLMNDPRVSTWVN